MHASLCLCLPRPVTLTKCIDSALSEILLLTLEQVRIQVPMWVWRVQR